MLFIIKHYTDSGITVIEITQIYYYIFLPIFYIFNIYTICKTYGFFFFFFGLNFITVSYRSSDSLSTDSFGSVQLLGQKDCSERFSVSSSGFNYIHVSIMYGSSVQSSKYRVWSCRIRRFFLLIKIDINASRVMFMIFRIDFVQNRLNNRPDSNLML